MFVFVSAGTDVISLLSSDRLCGGFSGGDELFMILPAPKPQRPPRCFAGAHGEALECRPGGSAGGGSGGILTLTFCSGGAQPDDTTRRGA